MVLCQEDGPFEFLPCPFVGYGTPENCVTLLSLSVLRERKREGGNIVPGT